MTVATAAVTAARTKPCVKPSRVSPDLPITWLVNVVQYVLHGAAEETRAERLDAEETGRVVTATVRSILAG
ncbi:hypothetical protein [Actinomadura coerulea]|uniref:hypothetical protein n=1 Tax=Actinomadura coerulea TaxID=46159 RepID=UPI0034139DCC